MKNLMKFIGLAFLTITLAFTNADKKTKTVVLDVSHGGHDSGTVINEFKEKDISLKIANKIKGLKLLVLTIKVIVKTAYIKPIVIAPTSPKKQTAFFLILKYPIIKLESITKTNIHLTAIESVKYPLLFTSTSVNNFDYLPLNDKL